MGGAEESLQTLQTLQQFCCRVHTVRSRKQFSKLTGPAGLKGLVFFVLLLFLRIMEKLFLQNVFYFLILIRPDTSWIVMAELRPDSTEFVGFWELG